ncbi:hypothetical protein MMC14_001465 [Varicellaria rhodocarpa]|nr:hypothetical protein [Varicellaria rhodocarpa]
MRGLSETRCQIEPKTVSGVLACAGHFGGTCGNCKWQDSAARYSVRDDHDESDQPDEDYGLDDGASLGKGNDQGKINDLEGELDEKGDDSGSARSEFSGEKEDEVVSMLPGFSDEREDDSESTWSGFSDTP